MNAAAALFSFVQVRDELRLFYCCCLTLQLKNIRPPRIRSSREKRPAGDEINRKKIQLPTAEARSSRNNNKVLLLLLTNYLLYAQPSTELLDDRHRASYVAVLSF